MRIALDGIDSHGALVDLPGTKQERIAVRSATKLRGVLEQAGDRIVLSETTAEAVVLDALRIVLGELVLSTARGATLQGVTVSLAQERASLALDAGAASLITADLAIAVDDVVLALGLTLTGARLSVRDAEGSLSAERVELTDFSLRVGDLQLASRAVNGHGVAIRWGAKGFALDAAALVAGALEVTSGNVRLALSGVQVDELALDGPKISVTHAKAERGRVQITIAPSTTPAATTTATTTSASPRSASSAAPFFDWRALDGLSGEIDVDVEVDLTVPLIGHRKATHRLRVPIAGGALDYRALENNLAALENALIDFALKDGVLRLERVNPLFPARGHGKPIVIWDLDAADHALAEQERVRLAVLPSARLAEGDAHEARDGHEPAKKSSVALRRLALHRIDVKLALAPITGPLVGQMRLRNIAALVLQGSVHHAPDEAQRPGSVLGELSGLSASLVGLPLGTSVLDVASLALASASPIEVTFLDVHPTNVQLDLEGLALDGVLVSAP